MTLDTTHLPSMADIYELGHQASTVLNFNTVGRIGLTSVRLELEKGEYPDPAVADFSLQMSLAAARVEFDVGAGRFTQNLKPNEFVICPPKTAAEYCFHGPATGGVLAITPERVMALFPDHNLAPSFDFGKLHSKFHHDAVVNGLVSTILDQTASTRTPSGIYLDSALITLLYHLRRLADQPLKAPSNKAALTKAKLACAIEFIESHLAQSIQLDDVAASVGLSAFHFARAFKNETGLSPHQFLIDRRVCRATQMLMESNLPIAAIAYAVGFSSQAHMTTVFQRLQGTTPGEYRRQLQ
jgi:AraC family transcriptional regulator